MIKKVVAAVMSAVLILGTVTIGYAADQNHWAQPYLENLFNYGIMRGDISGSFEPDRPITRAEFVSMTNRAFGYDDYKGKNPFRDITGKEWYADDMAIAYYKGYLSGVGRNVADPDGELTREQAVSIICRNLKLETPLGEDLHFTDSRTFSTWSRGHIATSAERGYINGYTDGSFRPKNNITRGEAAKIFSDVVGKLINNNGNYTFGNVSGNVTIASTDVELSDTTIYGDLYITSGVGTGFVRLNNVSVMGETIINGGGESNAGDNSIDFDSCFINKLIIDGDKDKVVALSCSNESTIVKTIAKTDTYIEDFDETGSGFLDIEVSGEPGTTLTVSGDFDKISIMKPENRLVVGRGTVQNIVVDEDAIDSILELSRNSYVSELSIDANCTVTGTGDIGRAVINTQGVTVEGLPDDIIIRPGITATVNGRNMTSSDGEMASSQPRISAGYPKEYEMGPKTANLLFETNKAGTIYWAVTLEEDDEPSKDEIMKPKNVKRILKSGIVKMTDGNVETNLNVSGLSADEDYVISAVLEDERSDTSRIKTYEFTTLDNLIPNFGKGYPAVKSTTSTSATFRIMTDKDCSAYWSVLPRNYTAPTERQLKNDDIDGDKDSGSERGLKKNREETFTATGLNEKTNYDIYIVLTDGDNDSKISKISFMTSDTTPPEFAADYPKEDKKTEKSVDVRIKVNETATVYYVAVPKGSVFPPPVPPAIKPPALDSQAAKDAVKTGNNTVVNGRFSVKENTEGILKVNKLEAETMYDLYLMAEDASGNQSVVVKTSIKTTDMVPPTASLSFSDEINGEPKVTSDVSIVFSEEVWDRITLQPITMEDLKSHVSFYDMSERKEVLMDIDYSLAKIELDEEYMRTVITFPPEALNLNSGDSYQVELNQIVDTSNNRMKDKTRLPIFKTVSPQVEIRRTESPDDMDITFEISPESVKTADTTMFDMIFESDTTVEFDLFIKDENGEFVKVLNKRGYRPLIFENSAMTLHYMIDRMDERKEDYVFEKFNELTYREYGIRFTGIEGIAERGSWNKDIEISIKCVIGSKTVLSALAGNPINGFATALKNGASQVNFPLEFSVSASFTDTVIPEFVYETENADRQYPRLTNNEIGDTLIRPIIMTTKNAELYYLIAPKGTVSYDDDDIAKQKEFALLVMGGSIRPNGGVRGSYTVESAFVEYPLLIEGLTPETDYDLFMFLKGTPAEPSNVTHRVFRTAKVAPPIISVQVTSRGEDSVTLRIESNKNATVDWILLPSLSTDGWFNEDKTDLNPGNEEFIAGIIRNGKENEVYRPIDFGTTKVRYNRTENKYYTEVTVKGIERNVYYNFFAVAKTTLGSGETNVGDDSNIAFQREITPVDVTPPTIHVNTVINNGSKQSAGKPYSGTVMIEFSEEVLYLPGENLDPQPLTAEFFANSIRTSAQSKDDIFDVDDDLPPAPETTVALFDYTTAKNADGERYIKTITFRFKRVVHNVEIVFPYLICDKNRNIAGMLRLTFVDKETGTEGEGRKSSEFVGSFYMEN